MATIGMGDIKKGVRLEITGNPYKVTEFQHVKPGKGAAFVRMKIKNLETAKTIEKTVHAGDKFEVPELEEKTMQFLYDDGEFLQFMDTTTFDQIGLTHEQVGKETFDYMVDGMETEILFHNGKAITVEIPVTYVYEVVETPPNFKGDSQGGKKPATLNSGAVVQVPFHVLEGDKIKVNTVEGEYLEKAK
ncbi:Translation elongation factor P [hydrothermal vent metagenome]|uniref:Translation elongation factor P n=1 Tax=hydrothermal vent metagenome TaxID=652676 RepID=A0A1W1BPC3_9ZZZZ